MAYNARPNQTNKYQQGYYNILNESKYISDTKQIIYRSSLELKLCSFADRSDKILKWGSEVISIPYIGADGKNHTYHVDFYLEVKNENIPTLMEKWVIEVKPDIEYQRVLKNTPPPKPEKITPTSLRNWEYALKEHIKNKHKWEYAIQWCKNRGMKFYVFTEKTISILTQ